MADVSKLIFSILQFCEDQKKSGDLNDDAVESLEVAAQCLESAYEINIHDEATRAKFQVSKNLLDIFNSYITTEKVEDYTTHSLREPTQEEKLEAEKFKNKGNDFMKAEKFSEALECYTKAIKLDNKNAVYYCNRAAANSKLTKHTLAIQDCKHALTIDPSYSKAYGRMGMAYLELEENEQARECYRKALELDPSNQSYQNNLDLVEQKLREQAIGSGFSMGSAGGQGFDLSSLLSNPSLLNMAANMMSNPQMQNMMANIMSGATQDQASGGLSSLLQAGQQLAAQMQQQNPELVAQLRQQVNPDQNQAEAQPDSQQQNDGSAQP